MHHRNIRISVALLLAIALLFSSVACAASRDDLPGNRPPEETTKEETTKEETTEEETTAEETTAEETTEEETTKEPEDEFLLSGFGEIPWPYGKAVNYPEHTGLSMTEEELKLSTQELIDLIFSPKYYEAYYSLIHNSVAHLDHYCDLDGNQYNIPWYLDCRNFNGFVELESRPDAASLLLEKYKNSLTDDCLKEYTSYMPEGPAATPDYTAQLVLPFVLEVLLARRAIFNQLTEEEQRELYETILIIRGKPEDRVTNHLYYMDASFLFFPHYKYREFKNNGKYVCWMYYE